VELEEEKNDLQQKLANEKRASRSQQGIHE